MEYDPKDNEVIHLLKKLKESNGAYPPDMLAQRRQGYLRQVSQFTAGAGLVIGLKNVLKEGKSSAGLSPAAGTIVEALLVIAILAEAGAVTYFYRNKLVTLFQSVTSSPRVEEVADPPVLGASPIPEVEFTPSPAITVAVSGTETLTLTAAGTPTPAFAVQSTQQNGGSGVNASSGGSNSSSSSAGTTNTEDPPISATQDPNGNNGNHYGQTPLPERTKEPGNNVSTQNRQENNTTTNTTTDTNTKTKKKP